MDAMQEAGRHEMVEKHVLRRYELCQRLGKGAYGIVWKCIEKRTRRLVALKKCYDVFRNPTDAQRTYREVMYLTYMAGHDNIVRLQQVIKGENDRDVYLLFDYMETDLFLVIQADKQHKIIDDIHKKYIIYQILKALKYMHSADLVHRDLKPSNVLMNRNCHVKLADLGLTRSVADPDHESPTLTDYVATRWYRAPEMLLGSVHYGVGIDIWSLGCLLGELLLHRPLFMGNSTLNQIEKILEVTGRPSGKDVKTLNSPYAATMLEALPSIRPTSLNEMMPDASSEALDFVAICATFSPSKRADVDNALRHPFVAEFHDPEDEPVYGKGSIRLGADDNTQLSSREYRQKLYEEIDRRKGEARKEEIAKLKRPSQTVLVVDHR